MVRVSARGDMLLEENPDPRSVLGRAGVASCCQVTSGPLEAGGQSPKADEASLLLHHLRGFFRFLSGSLSVISSSSFSSSQFSDPWWRSLLTWLEITGSARVATSVECREGVRGRSRAGVVPVHHWPRSLRGRAAFSLWLLPGAGWRLSHRLTRSGDPKEPRRVMKHKGAFPGLSAGLPWGPPRCARSRWCSSPPHPCGRQHAQESPGGLRACVPSSGRSGERLTPVVVCRGLSGRERSLEGPLCFSDLGQQSFPRACTCHSSVVWESQGLLSSDPGGGSASGVRPACIQAHRGRVCSCSQAARVEGRREKPDRDRKVDGHTGNGHKGRLSGKPGEHLLQSRRAVCWGDEVTTRGPCLSSCGLVWRVVGPIRAFALACERVWLWSGQGAGRIKEGGSGGMGGVGRGAVG